jgi:periplasmic divalent cation tolerance protein
LVEAPLGEAERPHRLALVFCNAPAEVAVRIARRVVELRLAACVNVIAGVTSVYRWEGAIQEERESTLLLKTRMARVEELTAAIREMHPYDVPEVIAVPLEPSAGNPAYLDWILAETRADGAP